MIHSDPKHVALYARVAAFNTQTGENNSIATQLTEMRTFAAQKGWIVITEFVDIGASGLTLERPGLQNLFAAARERAFDVALVYDIYRLTRSIADISTIFQELDKSNCDIISVQEPLFALSDHVIHNSISVEVSGVNNASTASIRSQVRERQERCIAVCTCAKRNASAKLGACCLLSTIERKNS